MKMPSFRGKLITQELSKKLYECISDDRAIEHWAKKGRIEKVLINLINWRLQGLALRAVPNSKRKFVTKWVSEWLGTGSNMVKWKLQFKGNCTHCDIVDENTSHILQCGNIEATKKWSNELENFNRKLGKFGMEPKLRKAICRNLNEWRQGRTPNATTRINRNLREDIAEQTKIGWKLS